MCTLTTYNERQHWDPIPAAVSVLNTYHLDAYTLCAVHEQDSVVARHKRTNYMHAIALVLYST